MADDVTRDARTGKVTGGSIRKVGRANRARYVSAKVKKLLQGMFGDEAGEWKPYAVAAEIMTSDASMPGDRLKAANMLAERMHGKAVQAIELSGPDGAPVQTESQVTHHAPAAERIADIFKTLSVMAQHGRLDVPGGTTGVGEESPPGDAGGP